MRTPLLFLWCWDATCQAPKMLAMLDLSRSRTSTPILVDVMQFIYEDYHRESQTRETIMAYHKMIVVHPLVCLARRTLMSYINPGWLLMSVRKPGLARLYCFWQKSVMHLQFWYLPAIQFSESLEFQVCISRSRNGHRTVTSQR